MNEEQFDKIIDALESDRYTQTRFAMMNGEGAVCALGVVALECGMHLTKHFNTHRYSELEDIIGHSWVQNIQVWNDIDGLSFQEIADRLKDYKQELVDQ